MANRDTNKSGIRFSEIRALDGKQSRGFEELCVQLLPWLITEKISGVTSVDGRGGDGGIEAIAHTTNGLLIGLQAKYFSKLSLPQWRQIDESVKTAIRNHPELTRYVVCVPIERTPAQITKWGNLINEWKTINSALIVEWAGESTLLGHLLKPDAGHLRVYWFNCPDFSLAWVNTQTQVAIKQLHDRYTPKLHQPTKSERLLGFLIATTSAQAEHHKQCSELVVAWRKVLRNLPPSPQREDPSTIKNNFRAAFDAMLSTIQEGSLVRQGYDFVATLENLRNNLDNVINDLSSINGKPGDAYSSSNSEFRSKSNFEDALDRTERIIRRSHQYLKAQQQPFLVLTGEAGTGKSHLLAELATRELNEGRACLLMIGERFAPNAILAEQIPALLHWSWSLSDLLACLSTYATLTGQPALLIVDAINEPRGSGLWRRELLSLISQIEEHPGIRLIVSCRNDCLRSALPAALQKKQNTIEHHGFDLQFHESVQAYFDGYEIISPQFPTLTPEYHNPLFLKTLCEAYQGRTLPLGAVTFIGVLAEWENRITANIEERVGCPQRTTRRAIDELVKALANSVAKRITADTANDICLKHFSEQRAFLSLYSCLTSEGLLQEVEAENETWVRLQYERFSDVRIAQIILKNFSSKEEWLKYWKSEFIPARTIAGNLDLRITPELTTYALLLPQTIGIELVECPISPALKTSWSRANAKERLWNAWLEALPWRAPSSSHDNIQKLFAMWANHCEDALQVWERLLQFSCIPNHPLNSDYLHKLLHHWDLPIREEQWTVTLALEEPQDQTNGSVVAPFLYWTAAAAGKSSDEQTRLAGQTLLWLTSSPNRMLRDQATDVAIRSLTACRKAGEVCTYLLEQFWEVDDPYVKERLLAVTCGVLPRLNPQNAKEIVNFILHKFWKVKDVPPHILQREYAAFVIRHACETGLIAKENLALLNRRPKQAKPKLWTEAQVEVYDKNPAYSEIASSLYPEEMGAGLYGDFGRYTMGYAVHHFADTERAESTTAGLFRGAGEHDARFARRYIWQRVIELGWTPERFSFFERNLGYTGRTSNSIRIERISKKYQWIGLHEYLGHLSDSLLFKEFDTTLRPLHGAWELHGRDYHPELAFATSRNADIKFHTAPETISFSNPILSLESEKEKLNWVQGKFQDFRTYLKTDHEKRSWITLKTHLNFDEIIGFGIENDGIARMAQWIDARVFFVPRADLAKSLMLLRKQDFFGNGCDVPHCTQCWVSEYPWHPSFDAVDLECLENNTWLGRTKADQRFYLPVCEITDDHRHVLLPAPSFHRDLGEILGRPLSAPTLTEQGVVEIYDDSGSCIFKSYTLDGSTLMIDETVLTKYLNARNFCLVWAVLSEKSAWDGRTHAGGLSNQSAVYLLEKDGTISGDHTLGETIPPEGKEK